MKRKLLVALALTGMLYTAIPKLCGQTIVNDVVTLQSAITSATEGEVIQLSSSFPAVLGSAISITINHANSFIIDGNGKTLTISGNYRHFLITKTTSTGTFTLKNIELKGLRTNSNGINGGTAGGGVTINSSSKGILEFDQVYFNSIQHGALGFSDLDVSAIVRVTNSTFRNNNKGDHGGGIYYKGSGNLEVLDCTFDENYNAGAGYSGGAIVCFNHTGQVSVRRSVFLNNLSVNWGGAIGVYSPAGNTSSVSIDSCYFEGNRVTIPNGNGDGGAVSVYGNASQVTKFNLQNSTFYKNYASDDGGALFIQNYDTGAENYVTNCTMYENYADDVNPAKSGSFNIATCGGAIQFSLKTPVVLEHNTIVENYTKSVYQRGGGIGFHAAMAGAPQVTLKNNIILGNYILDGSNNKVYNAHANVGFKALLNPGGSQSGNIGYDNGTSLPTDVTLLNALGNNNPVKWENHCSSKIGNPYETNTSYYRVIPTISIKPNDGMDVFGLADGQGISSTLTVDGRGYLRDQTNPNIGAVEIRWAKFNANGGDWTSLPNLTYNGTTYYEKDGSGMVQNCYQITNHNGSVTFPHAVPERAGYVFQCWALDAVNGAEWNGSPLTITSNRTLYARWRAGIFEFANDTICESDKMDLTNLKLLSGSLVGITLSYYMDRLCTIPVANPKSVGGGTYYIIGVNASSQRDTTSVDIIEKERVKIVLKLEKDTCFYKRITGLILEITDTSKIIIEGTGQWFLKDREIDPYTYVLSKSDKGKKLYYQIDTECGIARSNQIEISICELIPEITRPVSIPEVTGLKTSLEPGVHYVKSHDDFVFTITPLPGYNLDGVTVKTNNPLWDDEGGVKLIRIADDTIKVTIRQVTESLDLTIEGVKSTSNAVIDNTAIRTNGRQLFINVEKPVTLSVYTIYGSLYLQRRLGAGETTLSLASGIYIVVLDGKSYLKVVIK
ncbi:MAG: InlB B-repeat-containing protein [Tannerella sp.]|jgi:uncharacterized repeat protein (TIGR02543 family)|nr:InlB B-repeat-containing protein [Tannerella sp.]